MDLFPIFLNIVDKPCLVVGGGSVALRRTGSLSRAGARVTVVAPEILPAFRRFSGVTLLRREFRPAELKAGRRKPVLVVAATDRRDVNRAVALSCRARGILVNVADDPRQSDFHVPAVLCRAPLTMALSTGGASPALAKLMVRRAGTLFGPEFSRAAKGLARGRKRLLQMPLSKRRKILRGIFRKAGLVKTDK